MLCGQCRTVVRRNTREGRSMLARAAASRQRQTVLCDTCEALLRRSDSTELLLSMLARLAGFGLASCDGPLLRPRDAARPRTHDLQYS